MIRLLIADDHAIVREGLKQIVAEIGDMSVDGEASNGQQVMELVRQRDWDVVLLDLAMPGRGGIDTLRQLKREKPDLPVLILSIYPEDQYAVRALKDGAAGYLTKESAPEELVKAIRKAAKGRKYVSPALAERLAYELETDADKPPHQRLSDREIAQTLSISVLTAKTHARNIYQKLGVSGRRQAVAKARSLGILL